MEQAEIEKQLIELIVPLLDEPAPIAPDTDLVQEVGLPSLKVMELIEENDDVQKVFANFDISDEVMAKLAG